MWPFEACNTPHSRCAVLLVLVAPYPAKSQCCCLLLGAMTAAVLAGEWGGGVQVDGIYDSDPHKNPMAKRYAHLSYRKCVVDDLKVRPPLPLRPPSACGAIRFTRFIAFSLPCDACQLQTTSVYVLSDSAASPVPAPETIT